MSELTPEDRELLTKLLSKPLQLPEEFKGWLQKYASLYATPYLQELAGYRSRRWRMHNVPTFETGSSVGIGSALFDLATPGPLLEGLRDGTYATLFGWYTQDGTAITRGAQLSYNDGDAFSPFYTITQFGQSFGFDIHELSRDNDNSIKLRYFIATSNATANFGLRWLATVRVA